MQGTLNSGLTIPTTVFYGVLSSRPVPPSCFWVRSRNAATVWSICALASKFRGLLAGTFNELVKAVALAEDVDDVDDAAAATAAADEGQADTERGRRSLASGKDSASEGLASSGQLYGNMAAGVGKVAGNSIEEDGEVCHVTAHCTHSA